MKLLKESIDSKLKDILNNPKVVYAVNNGNWQFLYDVIDPWKPDSGELYEAITDILVKLNINPLLANKNYIEKNQNDMGTCFTDYDDDWMFYNTTDCDIGLDENERLYHLLKANGIEVSVNLCFEEVVPSASFTLTNDKDIRMNLNDWDYGDAAYWDAVNNSIKDGTLKLIVTKTGKLITDDSNQLDIFTAYLRDGEDYYRWGHNLMINLKIGEEIIPCGVIRKEWSYLDDDAKADCRYEALHIAQRVLNKWIDSTINNMKS